MITIKVNTEDAKRLIGGILVKMKNLKPAMKIVGETIRSSVIKNFMVGGRPKWKPTKYISKEIAYKMRGKKTKTKRGRVTKGFERYAAGKKTLIDTGRLKNSITARAFSDRAEVGTNVIYAAIHQFGGKAGRGHKVTIPARPYLMVQKEDWTEIKQSLVNYIMGGRK